MKNLLKYLVGAVIIAVPLYPKFPFLQIPFVSVSVRLEDFLILLTVCVFLITILPNVGDYLKKLDKSIFIFLAIGLISVLSGILITKTVIPVVGILHWVRRVEYMSMFFVGYAAIRNKEDLGFYIKCLALVVFVAFMVGIGQKYFDVPVITTQNSEYAKGLALRYLPGGHLVSTFAGHYDMAGYMVFVIPLLFALLFGKIDILKSLFNYKNVWVNRILILAPLIMAFWLLVQAASRISILSYLVSVTVVFVLIKRVRLIPIIIVLSIIFTGLSSNLVSRYLNIINVINTSVKEEISVYAADVYAQTTLEDRSTSIRLNVEWPRALRAFEKNIFLGTGYSSITLATDNDYLRLLGEAGLLGFISFMLVLANLIISKFNFVGDRDILSLDKLFVSSVLASIAGVLISMTFIDILEASKFAITFWLMNGISMRLTKENA